jgi:hypothetical protein
MLRCLFCGQEHEKLSAEHVFPAALGGNLELRDGVCTKCNNDFSEFERVLAKELVPIRLLLNIPDRYGDIPSASAVAKTKDGEYKATANADGSVQVRPVVTITTEADGAKNIRFQYATEKQVEEIKKGVAEKKLQMLEFEVRAPEQSEIEVSGELKVIGSPEGLRTAAKIAYVGMAFCTGSVFAASDAFTRVREYIKTGNGAPPARLFIHKKFLNAVQLGPHQHALILAGRKDKHRVDAIVRLFGGLNYFVTLSDEYGGVDFVHTIVCDAQRGELNGMLFSVVEAELLQTEDVATSKDTVWDNGELAGKWFLEFLDASIRHYLAQKQKAAKPAEAAPK